MKAAEVRRRSSRHPLCWEAAVVFDKAQGKPVVHTQTQDLSVSGAAIFSEYGDLTGSDVTLLLAHPPRKGGQAPKVLKVRAHVVSTARTPGMSKYRHGLSFIRSPDDSLGILAESLNSIVGATARAQPAAAAPAASPATIHTRVSDALRRAHRYLKDLAEQLNVLKPAYPKGYGIAGVPEFNGLAWEAGHAECHTREISPTVKLFEQVSLHFLLSGKKQIHVGREYPASEKLQQLLDDSNIEYTTQGVWSKRGSLDRTTFDFPCEVKASLLLVGQFETGRLLLSARNVSGFGSMEQILAPEAVTDESIDELRDFILGESPSLGPLLLRTA